MTDNDEVIDAAFVDGFTLEERLASHTQQWSWSFVREDDDRWPMYLERRQTISWMADLLHRIVVFR